MQKSFLNNVKKKFFDAPFADKQMVVYIFIWSAIIRFSLFFLPFKHYRGLLGTCQTEGPKDIDPNDLPMAIHIRNIVLAVCAHTPWESKCLVQAIICKRLLKKRGLGTTLYLGILKTEGTPKLDAHAWLKFGETVITGRYGHKRFSVVNFYG